MANSRWASVHLMDVCQKIGSGATPRGGKKTYLLDGPFALIRSQNVHNNFFNRQGLAFINEHQANDLDNVKVYVDDVLLNITGDSVARVCQVAPDVLPARVNQHVAIIRPDPRKLSPYFLRYYLASPEIQLKLLSWAGSGGTRNALTKGMIESFEVYAPSDVGEQRAIAHILCTLDDKIELNRRMNETLEAMARALFKSWFVDFDPVREKMAGRDTGLPPHLADLFPDRLAPSELGEIPEGWEVSSLSEIAISPRRGIDPNKVRFDTPYIGLEHMPRRSLSLGNWDNSEKVSSNKSLFRRGEFLFGKLRPYFHKVGIAPVNGICSTDVVVISPKCESYFAFVLSLISSDNFVSYTDQTSTGTKMPRTSWKTMGRFPVCIPNETVFQAFDGIAGSNFERIIENVHENRNLAAVRNTLLPKLISGKLRVQEAEAFLEQSF